MELLFDQSRILIILVVALLLLLAVEVGFRLGRRNSSTIDDHSKSQIISIQTAVLGLLALLLGFSFLMALSRFDTRKQLVLEEANAIGTAYLRADLLAEPRKTEVSDLLRLYVDARLEFYNAGRDQARLAAAVVRAEALQQELWSHAVAAAQEGPDSFQAELFVRSLNEVIDLDAKRTAARQNHVPEIVLFLLFVVAASALGAVGYGFGLGGHRHIGAALFMVVLIALVMLVILDLDRPTRGLITVSQESLLRLQETLNRPSP